MYDENADKKLNEEGTPNFILKDQTTAGFSSQDSHSPQYQNPAVQGENQNSQYQTTASQDSQNVQYQTTASQDSQNPQYQNPAVQGSQNPQYQNAAGQDSQASQYQNPAVQGSQIHQYQNPAGQGSQNPQYQSMSGQGSQGSQYQAGGSQNMQGQYSCQYAADQGHPCQNGTSQQPEGATRMYNWQNENPGAASDPGKANPDRPAHKEKKRRSGMGRKVAGITAAALLFGTVSGGTMVGINMLAGSLGQKEAYTQISPSEMPTEAPTTQAAITPSTRADAGTALALDVSDIVEQAMPSVVAINNTMLYEGNTWFGQRQQYEVPSSGSGIIVGKNDEELLIVTNNHVVEGSNTLSVTFIDEKSIDAIIKGTDPESDLAVVAVPLKDIPEDTMSQISIAKLGNSEELKVGQGVIAIGNALGYGQSTTVGYVSALDREVTTDGSTTRHLLQTDAAINPGNSGGALLNMKGEVIGINAAKYSRTDVEGIGYAIPVSQVQDIIDTLMIRRSKTVEEGQEGYLGIQGLTVDESMVKQLDMPAGVFVYAIVDDGAAADSDLREKDIITKFDGQSVRSMASLQDLLKRYKAGESVDLTVQSLENGKYVERTVTITLGKKATLGQDS